MKGRDIDENGALARWLCARYGGGEVRDNVREVARQLLMAGNQSGPPIDLRPLLRARRIKSYSTTNVTSGRLTVGEGGFGIEVSDWYRTPRTRFTLAHEIAHTVFYDLESPSPKRLLYGVRAQEEECFCNMLAAEILMPFWMIEKGIKEGGLRGSDDSPVQLIRGLAGRFRTSVEAMTRRVVEDLHIFRAIVLGGRWLPGIEVEGKKQSDATWRLCWWAASTDVLERLYLPPVSRRPSLKFNIIEKAFIGRKPITFEPQLAEIRLGNLRKIISEECGASTNRIRGWVEATVPEGLQLYAVVEGSASNPRDGWTVTRLSGVAKTDTVARKRAEIIIFFPLGEERDVQVGGLQEWRRAGM